MKKGLIVTGIIIAAAVIVLVTVVLAEKLNSSDNKTTTEPYVNAQLGITVDDWLKIIEITECDGKIAVVVENVSDSDVEYAVLTVKANTEEISFNVSALLSGTRAMLVCNEDISGNPESDYTLWKIKDKVVFENKPSMHSEKIEISLANGSVSLKNISGEEISSEIYVYYKEINEGLLNGSATGRFKVSGLKANSQTFVKAEKLNENNCQIIFIEYDDKEI